MYILARFLIIVIDSFMIGNICILFVRIEFIIVFQNLFKFLIKIRFLMQWNFKYFGLNQCYIN